jgi:hypothetical protein
MAATPLSFPETIDQSWHGYLSGSSREASELYGTGEPVPLSKTIRN